MLPAGARAFKPRGPARLGLGWLARPQLSLQTVFTAGLTPGGGLRGCAWSCSLTGKALQPTDAEQLAGRCRQGVCLRQRVWRASKSCPGGLRRCEPGQGRKAAALSASRSAFLGSTMEDGCRGACAFARAHPWRSQHLFLLQEESQVACEATGSQAEPARPVRERKDECPLRGRFTAFIPRRERSAWTTRSIASSRRPRST